MHEGSIEIEKRVTIPTRTDFNHLADHDVMCANQPRLLQIAVEGNDGVAERLIAGSEIHPVGGGITRRHIGLAASEKTRQFLVIAGQYVDAEPAIFEEQPGLRRIAVHADEQCRRLVRHRAHGGGGEPAAPGRSIGGYDIDRRADPRHGVTKLGTGDNGLRHGRLLIPRHRGHLPHGR